MPATPGIPKLILTQFLTYQDPSSPLLRTAGNFLLGDRASTEPSTLDSLSITQGWFMFLGQLFSSTLRDPRSILSTVSRSESVDGVSTHQPFDITIVSAFAKTLSCKTAHWNLCVENASLPSLRVARHTRRTENKHTQQDGNVSARVQLCSSITSSPARSPTAFLSLYLGWNGISSMCKSHVIDQAIFTDSVIHRESYCMMGALRDAEAQTHHERHSPLVTPLICLRRFMLLPQAIRRFLWAEADNVESTHTSQTSHAYHYVDPDGRNMQQHSVFPYPLYAPHLWSFWTATEQGDAASPAIDASPRQLKLEFEQSVVFEAVLAPFISTYRFLQAASNEYTADRRPRISYNTATDTWSVDQNEAVAFKFQDPFAISLSRMFHEFTVPLPASLRLNPSLMHERNYVDIRDLVHPSNNFTLIGTALYRLFHLHRLLQVASAIDDRCMLHIVQQVIDAHIPLLTLMTEHCMYQDDVLLTPWHDGSCNNPENGFVNGTRRDASHPLSPNALNEYSGVTKSPIPLVDVAAIPRVFFVWPSDSRFRVSLEESVSLSAALNGLGYFVRKQEARTATQDWADPALALKSLLTKYFPLRNFKRADKRIAFNCFDAHPGLAIAILNLLHVSQLSNVPGTEHRASFVCRLRHWSFHYTSALIPQRDVEFVDHACYQQWRTFHRTSIHELIGFYIVNCLPHLASTIFAHPRQGILYFKWITGVRYIMNVARRRYSQIPFLTLDEVYYDTYLKSRGACDVYVCKPGALSVLLLSQEIMIQRESDLMTKKLNIFMHHATETEAMSRWFWTLLDQLANRVLTTLRFLHRSRAPWSPESVHQSNLPARGVPSAVDQTGSAGDYGGDEARNNDDSAGEDEEDDDDDEQGRGAFGIPLADFRRTLAGDHTEEDDNLVPAEHETTLAALGLEIDYAGADSEDGVDLLAPNEFADTVNFDDDDDDDAFSRTLFRGDAEHDTGGVGLFASLFNNQDVARHQQIKSSAAKPQSDGSADDDNNIEFSFDELVQQLDKVTRVNTVLEPLSAADDSEPRQGERPSPLDHIRGRQERRAAVESYLRQQRDRMYEEITARVQGTAPSTGQKVVTAHGLEAWSLSDQQMNGVMQQFVRSLSYVPSLDDPGQEERHEKFRQFCYMVQRHSRPSSQDRIPLLALGYFGLSRTGLDFLHRLRVYDRHGLPPNRLETMVRLFWLKFPTDFALIARYLKYVQLYSMDQMLLLPKDVAETQYSSRVQAIHGSGVCYNIRRSQLKTKIDSNQASAYEKRAYERMAEALHVSCFCVSCRNWTEPLAPTISVTYTEQVKVPMELRRFKRQRLALGLQSEGRQTKNPVSASGRRLSSRARNGHKSATGSQQLPSSEHVPRVRLSHLPTIDPRRTVADFVSSVVRCLSDARARSSIGFSALLTELAYGRGISLPLDVLEQVNPPLGAQRKWYTADRMLKWLTYARLVHLFPIRPEQLDALMKQVSEIYPQLARRIQRDGFVATSVTAACPAELVSTYIATRGSSIDVDVMNEIELAMDRDDDQGPRHASREAHDTTRAYEPSFGEHYDGGNAGGESDAEDAGTGAGDCSKRSKTKRPKIGMSHTVDPEVQRFLPEYHFDSRVRFGQTNGMVHDDVLRDVSEVIRDGISSIRKSKSKNTRTICGAVAERVDMIGRIFFAPPHTHSINLYNSYVCCSLCPMIMRSQECQYSDTPGVGYVCAKHSSALRPIDPVNCDLDQFNAGGGGSYFPRIASLDPLSCTDGAPAELVASHTYYVSQPTHLLALPPQWWAVHSVAGHVALAEHIGGSDGRVPSKCSRCPAHANLYAHCILTMTVSKSTGKVAFQNLCENCRRKTVAKFQTRKPRSSVSCQASDGTAVENDELIESSADASIDFEQLGNDDPVQVDEGVHFAHTVMGDIYD